jgi:hypothetical protein
MEINKQPTVNLAPQHQAARDRLSQLAGKYSNFRFKRLGDLHGLKVQDANFIARKFDEVLPSFSVG